MLIAGPAASALGTRVLTPMPSAVKPNMPTTTASKKGTQLAGPWTLKARPTANMSTIWMAHTIIVLMKTADMRIHVGAGLRRKRLSNPISRRLTMVIDRTEKQEDMIP